MARKPRIKVLDEQQSGASTERRLLDALERYVDERVERARQQQDGDRLLTNAETYQMLGVSRETLHRWKRQGVLVPIQTGRVIRYRLADVRAYMDRVQQRGRSSSANEGVIEFMTFQFGSR